LARGFPTTTGVAYWRIRLNVFMTKRGRSGANMSCQKPNSSCSSLSLPTKRQMNYWGSAADSHLIFRQAIIIFSMSRVLEN